MKSTRRKFIQRSAAIVGSAYCYSGARVNNPGDGTDDMVYVPAGPFVKGLTVDLAAEIAQKYAVHPSQFINTGPWPAEEINIEGFYIDRYPVTNRDYKRFVDATGYVAPVSWKGLEYPAGSAEVPITGVTCEDAEAYCKWAGKRLPSEEEWEKAARGTDGRLYPWGNEWKPAACRMDSTRSPGDSFGPTPVGSYPDDKSPYGVMDMAGNVEEWVSNKLGGLRLTKGGSFVHSQPYNFLCARKFAHHSVVMRALDYIGFRCAKTGDGQKQGSGVQGSTARSQKNFSSGALPPIEAAQYLTQPIRLSFGIHGNLTEFIRLGVVNIMSIEVPYFPRDQFMVWAAETFGEAKAELSSDKRTAFYRGDKFGRQVEVRIRGEMDSVDMMYREKNTGRQRNTAIVANNCFNPLGAPNFCDHEGSRTFIFTGRGFRRINEMDYNFVQGGYFSHFTDFACPLLAIVSRNGDWVISQSCAEAPALWNNLEWSCLHAPFSQITIEPEQEVVIRQKIYFLRGTLEDLLARWRRDFGKA